MKNEVTGFVGLGAMDQPMASPLLDPCHALFAQTLALGHGASDMVAVLHAIEACSEPWPRP